MMFSKKEIKVKRPAMSDPRREYWKGSFFENLKERWVHRGETIRVDLRQMYITVGDEEGAYYDRGDYWTEMSSDALHSAGYLPVVRMPGYDSLPWWGQKVYMRLENAEQFDIRQKDEYGQFIYSQDTPSTLHDEMVSNATRDFIKAMFKTTLPSIDIQKIIMIAILGVGAFFGLMMMGII